MRKSYISLLLFCFIATGLLAQTNTIVNGSVTNAQTKENLAAVTVTIKGSTAGTYTDEKGNFRLVTVKKPPFTISISSIGYKPVEEAVQTADQRIVVQLEPSYALGQEIVVAASRVPERILESPVTIQRLNSAALHNAPGPNYYDALDHLTGVDVVTSSFTFKTVSTRGFNGSGNLRFNQLVDGMDNSAPALNFSVGNVIGLTDLDVDNLELLSGASSALYGSGGMNGTLLITSKDPFKYQGLSIEVKEGAMHVNDYRHCATPFDDLALRWGKKVSDKFSFKIGAEYVKANDWQANDSSDLERNNIISNLKTGPNTTRTTDPNYDGVNVYGDEASAGLQNIALAGIFGSGNTTLPGVEKNLYGILGHAPTQAQIIDYYANNVLYGPYSVLAGGIVKGTFVTNGVPINASRTGYYEKNLVDYNSYDLKFSGGLYYKISPATEVSLTGNWGEGTSVYTGADRYSLKNFSIGQYKLEFKNPNWFLRGYTTQENSGDSYATTLTALSINNQWEKDLNWFGNYTTVFAASRGNDAAARAYADQGRFLPGTPQFDSAFNKSVKTSINNGGSQFADKSALYQAEGQYNFSRFVKVVDVLAGASYRQYHLNSGNTIFYEPNGPINISEYGAYVQLQKQLFNDILKLSASGRYDKSQNFSGRFTPRATATIKVAKDNNFRLSYQQAYRFPDNQDQYINLQTAGGTLIGCLPEFSTKYQFDQYPVYTSQSVASFQASGGTTALVPAFFTKAKPETMQSYEVGYRGVINNKLLIDAYYYFSRYKDFIGREAVSRGDSAGHPTNNPIYLSSPFTLDNYSFVENSPTPVNANGWGFSAAYKIYKDYMLTGNVYQDMLSNIPANFVTFFNTPRTRLNLGVSNSNAAKGFGFNVIYKWQDKTYWEGTFGTGNIPAFSTLDAQISYHFTKQKVLVKLGGTNIINHYYRNAFGNPYIGALYYASFGYDIF